MAGKINSMAIRKMLFSKVHKQFGGHIRLMVSGGAKIDKNILEDFRTMGFRAIQGYGMTETAPIITFNVPGRERSDSAGEVIPDVEVKITDDGEILVKGKNVMKGYYNNEQATKEALENKRVLEYWQSEYGKMLHMEIGAMLVGHIHNYEKKVFLRGEEKGYFFLRRFKHCGDSRKRDRDR